MSPSLLRINKFNSLTLVDMRASVPYQPTRVTYSDPPIGFKALGLRLLVDDFGIGNPSQSSLQGPDMNLPEIDRSFTGKIAGGKRSKDFSRKFC